MTYLPVDTRLAAVCVYCLGMAAFTMIMGNAFAAFPVLTGGIAIPIFDQPLRRKSCRWSPP